MIGRLAWMEWRRLMRTSLAWIVLAVGLCLLSWQFLGTLEAFVGMQGGDRNLGLSHHLGLQLFGLAQAIIHDPRVVILDEPTDGLDPAQIRQVRELIRSLAETLGLLLLGALFTAAGLYLSVMSENPAVAAAAGYGLLLLLSLLDQHTRSDGFLHWLGWPSHYLNLQLGLVNSSDVAYFLLLMLFFLGLALHRLDKRRVG
ncbi:MAG: ABC transporter permease [Candidatus Thiodiazotropha sp.]